MNTLNIREINEQVQAMYIALDKVAFDKRVWLVLGGPTKLECAGCTARCACDEECGRYRKVDVRSARLVWARNALEWLEKGQKLIDETKGT